VVEKLIEALGFRQIGVVREEYAADLPSGCGTAMTNHSD
jgi:hypothetical protein